MTAPDSAAAGSTIAVLGAGGLMGEAMAVNLARSGLNVRGWNRSKDKAAPLADAGGLVADRPAQAARGADVVLTMLSDGDAVVAAMTGDGGALAEMSPESIWLQMSTIGETATTRCIELAAAAGIGFFDAPVLGTRRPAQEGMLVVLASGPEELRERVRPIFDVLGQRTLWLGEAGAGSRLKLVLNAWVVTVVEAGAEIVALAEGFGLDPRLIFEALQGGALDLPYLRLKGQAMIDREFTPAFRLALAAKDAALVADAAREHGLDLPVLAAVAERMAEGARTHGDHDFSATYLTSSPRAARSS
jgi:3-hydroxyisobutyrate dehydrogenase